MITAVYDRLEKRYGAMRWMNGQALHSLATDVVQTGAEIILDLLESSRIRREDEPVPRVRCKFAAGG